MLYTCTNRYAPAWAATTGNHTLSVDQEWAVQICNQQKKLKALCQARLSSLMLSLKMPCEWRYTEPFIRRKATHMICIFHFFNVFLWTDTLENIHFSHNLFCQEFSEEWHVNVRKPQTLQKAASVPVDYPILFTHFLELFFLSMRPWATTLYHIPPVLETRTEQLLTEPKLPQGHLWWTANPTWTQSYHELYSQERSLLQHRKVLSQASSWTYYSILETERPYLCSSD